MSNNVGSINDSRINVKKCASRNGLKLRSANTARSMRCNTAVQDRGRRLNQSQFRSMAEVSFLPSANTRKRASASREGEFSERLFTDSAAEEAIALFRDKLNKVSEEIVERNSKLEIPYIYLLPENIPNSVAI